MSEAEKSWQRLDHWLWCARFRRTRTAATAWVEQGGIRLNRQVTNKPHARLRPGDVLTLMAADGVRVVRVLALGARRGPPASARSLYADIPPPEPAAHPCAAEASSAYPPPVGTEIFDPGNER